MTKKQKFVEFVDKELFSKVENIDSDVADYWNALKSTETKEKPMFTDNGKLILQFLQDHPETKTWKSKDIAEELFIASRSVSGAIRKLVTDGFVEKEGKNVSVD
jgi:DNA-binding MarR family transcriptional regulator